MQIDLVISVSPALQTTLDNIVAGLNGIVSESKNYRGEEVEAPARPSKNGKKVDPPARNEEPAPSDAEIEDAAPVKNKKAISLEEVRALVVEKSAEGHRSAIKDMLTEFDAENVGSLDKKHYPAFISKLQAV